MTKKAPGKSKTTGKTPTITEQTHYKKVGRLKKPIADAIGREPAYIYISQNYMKHIFLRHKKEIAALGFTPKAFVDLVVANFNCIYKGIAGESLLLVIQNGKSKVVAIEINYALKEEFYEVKTAFVTEKNLLEKRELLWTKLKKGL